MMAGPRMLSGANLAVNHGPQIIDTAFVMFFLSFTGVVLRFTCRRLLRIPSLLDDYLIIMALV